MKAVTVLLAVCLLIISSCTDNKLESDLQTANTTIQLLRTQVNNSNAEMQALREQLNAANSTVQRLQQEIASGNATNRSLQGLLTAAQGQLAAANSSLQSLQQQLNSSNVTVRALQGQLAAANVSLQTLQFQVSAANNTIQVLQGQLTTANGRVQTLEQQLVQANAEIALLRNHAEVLSRIAPAPNTVITVDYDYLLNLAQTNEVALNALYRYQLVQMSGLRVVRVRDTTFNVDLMSSANRSLALTFKSAFGLEKLAPNMTITVYGTCGGSVNGALVFGPDFVLVKIDPPL